MTKLRFYFILCKDEETLLRADETDVTIAVSYTHLTLPTKLEV